MGSGSSRGGRALKRLRGADSRPAGPGGAAPEGGTGPPASATAAAREEAPQAAEGAAGPAAPPDGRDETLRLLDQLLAESAAWVPGELAPRGPARPRPAAGAGSPVSLAGFLFGNTFPKPGLVKGGGALGDGTSVSEPPIEKVLRPLTNAQQPSQLSPRGPWAHSLPGKLRKGAVRVAPKQSAEDHPEGSSVSEAPGSCYERPERPSAITYDYSEEELMASIEQEYCC